MYSKLSKEYKVYGIDLPGFGLSSHPVPFNIEDSD